MHVRSHLVQDFEGKHFSKSINHSLDVPRRSAKYLVVFGGLSISGLICLGDCKVLAIDATSFKICFAASTIVQCVQRNGNCDLVPEHS